MPTPWLTYEQKAGEPVQIGSRRLVPFARVLHLQNPSWKQAGLIWNRPVSVLVVEADGSERVLPVPDITRQIQFSLLGAGLAGALLIWSIFRIFEQKKESAS